MIIVPGQKFCPGRVVITTTCLDNVEAAYIREALVRFLSCDWGDLCEEDKEVNNQALRGDGRLFGAYWTNSLHRLYIITEDVYCSNVVGPNAQNVTTIMMSDEY